MINLELVFTFSIHSRLFLRNMDAAKKFHATSLIDMPERDIFAYSKLARAQITKYLIIMLKPQGLGDGHPASSQQAPAQVPTTIVDRYSF